MGKCQICENCHHEAVTTLKGQRIAHGLAVDWSLRYCGHHTPDEIERAIKGCCSRKTVATLITNPFLEIKEKTYGMGKAAS